MEPEYIAVTENGNTAYVTLQVRKAAFFLYDEGSQPRQKPK